MSEQKAVLGLSLELLSEYLRVVLGDREFCSPKLGSCLTPQGVDFCLRLKGDTNIQQDNALYQQLREYRLIRGMTLFLNDRQVTQHKGLGGFNVAGKWKRT